MKYLKTYEFSQDYLDNYFVWQFPNKPEKPIGFIIVQKFKIFGDSAKIQILHVYDIEGNSLSNLVDSQPYSKELHIITKDIVYSSNNLQDCLDKLPLLSKLDKYNL